MGINSIPRWVKVLMLKGEKGDRPTISTAPIDNGTEVTFSYSDGTSESVDLHNATSGDYSGLTNKPSINGVTVSGDKNSVDYMISIGVIRTLVDTESVGANDYQSGSVSLSDIASPEGYVPIGVIGFNCNASATEDGIPSRNTKVICTNPRMIFYTTGEHAGSPSYLAYDIYNNDSIAYTKVLTQFWILCVREEIWDHIYR